MQKPFIASFALFAIASMAFAQGTKETAVTGATRKTYVVGISKMMSHPALDAIEQGIMDYLATTDLSITYDRQNCNGDVSTAISIAQKFKDSKCDAVVGIATPPAQALATTFKDIPVVFSGVTDPLSAGLIADYDHQTETNVCGASDKSPQKEQLEMFFKATNIKTMGMVYTASEANGVYQMEVAKQVCKANGITFVGAAVQNSSEVKMAAQSIIDRVDGMYVAIDNTVVSAIASVDDVCYQAKKPLFNSDTTSSEGTRFFMSSSFNYYNHGYESGKIVERVLRGENPKDIGAIFFTDMKLMDLIFNLDSASYLGIEIPADLLAQANYVVKDGKTQANR